MLLYAAQLLAVAGRENAIVTYSDEMVRQYMKRQQIQKSINGSGHNLMFASFPVILVIVQDFGVGHIQDSGIGYGHTVGIAPDVLEHLSDSLGRRLGMNDPGFAETLLAGSLWDGGSLLLQPACQQTHETPTELVAHGSHREKERRTPASMYLMPYAISVNPSTRYNAVNMGVVKKIRSPRMEDGCHASEQSLIGGKCINGSPCSLEHAVVELPLIGHRDRMQTVGQREHDMEILGRDDFFPAELYPLLTLLVLTFGTMTVSAAVVAYSDIPTFGTYLNMPSKGTGTALCHVSEGSFNRRHDMMSAKELSTMAPNELTDVEASPHLDFGGNIVSINRTCFIGSISAT